MPRSRPPALGEHGRGFAVVADEVRKLADRTTKATDEIAGSIRQIQEETGRAVERMNTGTDLVEAGVVRASGAGDSLKQIVSHAAEVAKMIEVIASAAEEQSATSEQVAKNIDSVRDRHAAGQRGAPNRRPIPRVCSQTAPNNSSESSARST